MALGSLATHIFVAGMPLAAQEFGVPDATMQLSLTLSLAGAGLADLTAGAMSDRHGRRPILLGGAGLFALTSLVLWLSPAAWVLIIARFFQALGAGACRVGARAAVRDNVAPDLVARRFAAVTAAQSLAPIAAPAVGGLLVALFGWRSIFVFSFAFVSVVLVLLAVFFTETNRSRSHSQGPGLSAMLGSMAILLRSRRFLGFTIGGALSNGSFFAISAAMPFVLTQRLHQSPDHVGVIFLIFTCGVFLGMTTSGQLVKRRVSLLRLTIAGNLLALMSAAALVAVSLSDLLSVFTVTPTLVLFSMGCGMVLPVAMAGALADFPERAGAAAGLFGFSMQATGIVATIIVGQIADQALGTGLILLTATVAAQIVLRVMLRR
jgi:DHA1 family bicyclomycin/chloramphenicol resistance-like MFS transporter